MKPRGRTLFTKQTWRCRRIHFASLSEVGNREISYAPVTTQEGNSDCRKTDKLEINRDNVFRQNSIVIIHYGVF